MLDARALGLVVSITVIVMVCVIAFFILKRRSVSPASALEEYAEPFEYRSQLLVTAIEVKEDDKVLLLSTDAEQATPVHFADILACEIVANGASMHAATRDRHELGQTVLQELLQSLIELRRRKLAKQEEIRIDLSIRYASAAAPFTLNFYNRVGRHRITKDSLEDSARLMLAWYSYLSSEVLVQAEAAPTASPVREQPVETASAPLRELTRSSLTTELERLADMRRRGLLSEEEFAQAKKKLFQQ